MATYWVDPVGGDDGNGGTSAGDAFETLVAAFAAAGNRDTLNLMSTGTHLSVPFGDRLAGAGTFVGTSWADPGLVIQGVDADGNPSLATVEVSAPDQYFANFSWNDYYVLIKGISFDMRPINDLGGGSDSWKLFGTGTAPRHFKIYSCVFLVADLGDSWNYDTFNLPINWIGTGTPSPASEVEIAYCAFINCYVRQLDYADNLTANWHHNVFLKYTTDNDATFNMYTILGGNATLSSTNLALGFYNNTMWAKHPDSEGSSAHLTCEARDPSIIQYHSNVYYMEIGDGYSGDQYTAMIQSAAATTNLSTGVFDHNVFAFEGYNTTNAVSSSGGYGNYYFNEEWRDDGSPTTGNNTPNTNDVAIQDASFTDLFNSATTWTWTTEHGYDIELPFDLRLVSNRDVGLGGTVPGAISEAANTPPAIDSDFSPSLFVSPGGTVSVSAASGLSTVASDADLDTLTYGVLDNVTHGTLTLNTTDGSFEYTAPTTYAGTAFWSFKVCDAATCATFITDTSQNPRVFIYVVNATPVINGPLSFNTNENQALNVTAGSGLLSGASDSDATQTLLVTDVGTPIHGAVTYNATTGSFVYTPDPWFSGLDAFTYRVTDGITNSGPGTVVITVNEVTPLEPTRLFVDTAPFFKPVLKLDANVTYRGKRNRHIRQDLRRYDESILWEESTHRYFNLATNTTKQINLGGVSEAAYLVIESDTQIGVSVNSASNFVPVDGVLGIMNTAVTSLYFQNSSTDTTARVVVLAVD